MATSKGIYRTMLDTTPEAGKQFPPGALIGGKAEVVYDERTLDENVDVEDGLVELGEVKSGKYCVGGQFVYGAMGNDVVMSLGTEDDPDFYVLERDVAEAGSCVFDGAGVGQQVEETGPMVLTISGEDPADGEKVRVTGLFTAG